MRIVHERLDGALDWIYKSIKRRCGSRSENDNPFACEQVWRSFDGPGRSVINRMDAIRRSASK